MLRRAGLLVVAAALVVGLGGPAYGDPSAIGDGSQVGDGDYIGSANPDPGQVDATAGTARDDACAPVSGAVGAADLAAAVQEAQVLSVQTPR